MKKVNKTSRLTIGKLSKETGVNIETIRYYEKIDIMPKPGRSAGGNRLYEEEHVKRLVFIRRSRELGFSLDEIQELLRLVDENTFTCAEIAALAQKHLDDIKAKIKDLKKIEQHMKDMLSQCSKDNTPDCAVIDVLSSKLKT
ncbi:MAG: MerR family transcriptional regulator [Nitrosomonas sp.]|nr:MAG: MerR family transcriptional regulator [Nitrosomonas sp.]